MKDIMNKKYHPYIYMLFYYCSRSRFSYKTLSKFKPSWKHKYIFIRADFEKVFNFALNYERKKFKFNS